ncbi:hypothetical protein SAY87_021071 [Trapa incisa]|uniref:PRONE domain-containing protein n=1 Tax=Trapa incisa TaxID=236973 RepID=A0AAN7JWM4_9MYRT|nr:hypothetical protein SAY87_021071 [Trapa incisa]
MITMSRTLVCCTRGREISVDFEEQERVITYDGLETCILNNQSYDNESRTSRDDWFPTDSLDEDDSSCSSSKDASGSFSSKWSSLKREDHDQEKYDWEFTGSPQHCYVKEKQMYTINPSDVETMKEKFVKLLLGDDTTGGKDGLSSALALSNAISNLAVSVFGELWKLEPLPEERKRKWRREMDWLLSPTNYMVELVPTKQCGPNGCMLEIMTPKARADILLNLPALQKLDSMLIEALDSMVNKEFCYAEGVSQAERRSKGDILNKPWWLPSPRVPSSGLSDSGRKKLMHQRRVIHQVMKAAKTINENVLLEMPIPTIIRNALPKSGRANLGDGLYKVLTSTCSSNEMIRFLNLKSEHNALDCLNRLEAAVLVWKEKIMGKVLNNSPMGRSWTFMKDHMSEVDKIESLVDRSENLIQHLKSQYPGLPHTFLDATKVQYGKDVGNAILESYSRVLGNVAFRVLCRIHDILQEDALWNPNSPSLSCCFPGMKYSDPFEDPGKNRGLGTL